MECLYSSALQSFGLHSPDNWPEGADVDFIDIGDLESEVKVTSDDAVEAVNPAYFQAGYTSRRQLYLDPDIIGACVFFDLHEMRLESLQN